MTNPTVSIIVPSRNKAKFISATLDSILGQSFGNFEALVVDNCSKDNSRDIIRSYSKKDKRIRLIENEQDGGIVYSLNKGLSLAKGDFICVLHCDDLWAANFLASSIALFEKNQSAGLCFCRYRNIDENGNAHSIAPRNFFTGASRLLPSGEFFESLLSRDYMPVCTVMVRREAHGACGMYDMQYPGPSDYQMWLKIAAKFDGIYNSESTSSYRIYGENDTNYLIDNNISIMEQYGMVKKLFREYLPPSEKARAQEKTMLRNAALSLLRQGVNSIGRGKGGLCRSQCALAIAVFGGISIHFIAWLLYLASFLTPLIAPLVRFGIKSSLPAAKKAGIY